MTLKRLQGAFDEIGFDLSKVGRRAVDAALRRRAETLKLSDAQYEQLLASSHVEQRRLVDEVLIGETWFFRDPAALTALCSQAEETRRQSSRILKVLCAPCASGEEAYSTAIALLASGTPPTRFQIDGADLSDRFLSCAREARYPASSFRGARMARWQDYFESDGAVRIPIEAARRRVRFFEVNLLASQPLEARGPYDFILCRNLLIYLTADGRSILLAGLRRLLRPEGMLFVGPAEGSAAAAAGFHPAGDPAAFGFRPSPTSMKKLKSAGPSKSVRRRPPPAAATPTPTVDLLTVARQLADCGRSDAALELCRRRLAEWGPDCETFVLLGLLRSAEGDHAEAEACFERALYLDPENEEALVHLALLVEARGDAAAAARLRKRARRRSERTSDSRGSL